jgi:hypothetical protein
VIVTEKIPEIPATPKLSPPTPATPRAERRQDMPPAISPARPPHEVSRDLPPLQIDPLPGARARPTPLPAPSTPTPSPIPVPTSTPIPPPGPRAADGNEEGVEAEDPNTRLIGTWNGTHTGHAAQLLVRQLNRDTGEFRGILTVQMPSGPVRIAVAGQVFDDGGITIRETRVLDAPEERAWDTGINTGTFDPDDMTISGQGKDKRGRRYNWSFRR